MTQDITLNHITKIEGHAKLHLQVEKGVIQVCELSATEGARYFEGIVLGRKYNEASEITSRICGICSCAHVIASITAVEKAIGYKPTEQTRQLRVLLTLGERIRSHATHLYFLALPDYLGYESALAMAKDYKPQLQVALRLMQLGNKIIKVLAARDLHPVSATVGGWLHLPSQAQLDELKLDLERVKPDAIATAELFSKLKQPKFETEGMWFSLTDPDEYAVLEGNFCSPKHCFDPQHYKDFMREYHVESSTANFVVAEDHKYFVGALARLNNNHKFLSKDAKLMLEKSKVKLPSKNPFYNNLSQAIEVIHCIDHAIQVCGMKIKPEPVEQPQLRPGTGVGAVEVPRGTLWHEYTLNEQGVITKANIVTPTAQNLLNMQEDIRQFVPSILNKPRETIVLEVEKLIRSYDPCFSCSAHFLEVNWE